MGKKGNKDGKTGFQLKTPKGTRDWSGSDVAIRDQIFHTISQVFKKHGAVSLDTPVFELREILAGKYGEDSKLIYDLQDQGGELCSLRYDLTVPLARWLAMNPQVQSIKRYQIAKVYRRDQPAMTKGRMREFYQCDFDIAGTYDPMIPDAEILRITSEAFDELGFKGRYSIKINHRRILDGIFATAGVPEEKLRSISSAVDKLDKLPWEEVKNEMCNEKGLDPAVADRIGEYVKHKGGRDILDLLRSDSALSENANAKAGIDDMELLFKYCEIFGVMDKLSFDLSLARGLDYYTGVIYELVTDVSAPAVQTGDPKAQALQQKAKKDKTLDDDDRSNDPTIGVGSLAAGGRYDDLVGMFNSKGRIPCVGISLGVDRIFSVIKARLESEQKGVSVRSSEIEVYVMAFGGKGFTGMLPERMQVARELWDGGIKAEFSWSVKPKLPAQFKAAEAGGVPFAVILGEDELAAGQVKIKQLGLPPDHPEKEGVLVDKTDLVKEVRSRMTNFGADSLAERLGAVKVQDGAEVSK